MIITQLIMYLFSPLGGNPYPYQQGTALLYFVMDQQGHVLRYDLHRSSGFALLDREATALIERAQPLPTPPPSYQQARMEIVVPIQFSLR